MSTQDTTKYTDTDLSQAKWHKSSLSNPSGNCVEIAEVDGKFAVRDAKDRGRGALIFTKSEWKAFVGGVRNGEFDVK